MDRALHHLPAKGSQVKYPKPGSSFRGYYTGDLVGIKGEDEKDGWIISRFQKDENAAVLARFDQRRVVKMDQLYRSSNKPSDTPVRNRDISTF